LYLPIRPTVLNAGFMAALNHTLPRGKPQDVHRLSAFCGSHDRFPLRSRFV
jgi:hypothetical protein